MKMNKIDFLNRRDADGVETKFKRVRSWYLYEQFQSLKENQLDAAQRLKNRSYQEKLLFQELSERKARRCLCDQYSQSENDRMMFDAVNTIDTRTPISASSDNFYETFSDLRENTSSHVFNYTPNVIDVDEKVLDDWSSKDSVFKSDRDFCEGCYENIESIADIKIISKMNENMDRCPEICEPCDNENVPEEEQANDINLDEFNDKMFGDDKLSDILSLDSYGKLTLKNCSNCNNNKPCIRFENSLQAVWSKLVSFAYQVVQLNHGNCYCDYSSQILTAVLACDVLVKGVSKVCHTIQPYTSPVKFASSDDGSAASSVKSKKKKRSFAKSKTFTNKLAGELKSKSKKNAKQFQSENTYCPNQCRCKRYLNKCGLSEPWNFICDDSGSNTSSDSDLWSPYNEDEYSCECHREKFSNPMAKLLDHIDEQMKLWHDLSKRI